MQQQVKGLIADRGGQALIICLRTYIVAPFFLKNAARWADALRDAGADVVMNERRGSHGDAFWQEEFLLMVAWAFGR